MRLIIQDEQGKTISTSDFKSTEKGGYYAMVSIFTMSGTTWGGGCNLFPKKASATVKALSEKDAEIARLTALLAKK